MIEIQPLPWPEDSLEPVISSETIQYHYHKHHKGYVDKLNAKIAEDPELDISLGQLTNKKRVGEGVFNLAAQVFNHTLYWKSLTPKITAPGPSTVSLFGDRSIRDLRNEFIKVAMSNFGSGWTWFVNDSGTLKFVNTDDADIPDQDSYEMLAVIDVWEHAYYVDYRNDRKDYLDEVWNLLNWDFIESSVKMGL